MTDQNSTNHSLPGQPAQVGALLDHTGSALGRVSDWSARTTGHALELAAEELADRKQKKAKPGLLVRGWRALFTGVQLPHIRRSLRPKSTAPARAVPVGRPAPKRPNRTVWFVIPLVLVNTVAVFGQVGWARDHLHAAALPMLPGYSWAGYALSAVNLAIALMFAAVIESIGLYLSAEAHAALMHRDPALKLRLASYGMGGVAGAINYSHYAHDWHPTTQAVAFGLLSTISPWLWTIRARARSRAVLVEQGLIDARAAHFSGAKWINFPVHTLRAFRLAVSTGETREREAWQAYWARREQAAADKALRVANEEFEMAANAAPHLSVAIWSGAVDRESTGQQPIGEVPEPTGHLTARTDQPTAKKPTSRAATEPTVEADRRLVTEPTDKPTAEPTGHVDRQSTARTDRKPAPKPTGRRRAKSTGRGDYSATLATLRRTFPKELPTVSEVRLADGNRSQGRALMILRQLKRERGISGDPKERVG